MREATEDRYSVGITGRTMRLTTMVDEGLPARKMNTAKLEDDDGAVHRQLRVAAERERCSYPGTSRKKKKHISIDTDTARRPTES